MAEKIVALAKTVARGADKMAEVVQNINKLPASKLEDITKSDLKAAASAILRERKAEKLKTGDKVKFKKNYSVQEGMALDPITGRGVGPASDVDKGKAGKVTRSAEPGFLQSERTQGSRAKAQTKADLQRIFQEGSTATAAEKKAAREKYDALIAKDKVDTARAVAKGASTRTKKDVALPPLKSIKPEPKKDTRAPKITDQGEIINPEAFDKLPKNRQLALYRDALSRAGGTRARQIQARIDELAPTQAGETGVRRRKQGQTYGMRGAESKPKNIDEGVSKGRGGLDFNKGGMATKNRKGAHDHRKTGLTLSVVDRRKKK